MTQLKTSSELHVRSKNLGQHVFLFGHVNVMHYFFGSELRFYGTVFQ
jgi:hypothetical protein